MSACSLDANALRIGSLLNIDMRMVGVSMLHGFLVGWIGLLCALQSEKRINK